MWKLFGLTENQNSCEHPCIGFDDERRLWFCSDFNHLIKNFRNFLVSNTETWTPNGVVKMSHFEAVLECDGGNKGYGLKIAHKLTKAHLNPTSMQKMNVAMTFQLFAEPVSAAMVLYKNRSEKLKDSEPTVAFIKMLHRVIVAMSSCHSGTALSPGNDTAKVIEDFLAYLEEWQYQAAQGNYKFIPPNTHQGLIVTLKTALDVCNYLTQECNYEFLMTSRLNQDALEGFFGMVRSSCGSSDHPDAILFLQVYRLLSFYSLVKPPKGSNVEGMEIFETFLNFEDTSVTSKARDEWEDVLDTIISKGPDSRTVHRAGDEHDYDVSRVNEFVQAYFAGFVARKLRTWTSCSECVATLTKEKGEEAQDALITELSKGGLLYPSNNLFGLLCACERAILKTTGTEQVGAYTFLHIADNVLAESAPFVGCPEHTDDITKRVINYYIISRARILGKQYNKVHDAKRKAEQAHRKLAKL